MTLSANTTLFLFFSLFPCAVLLQLLLLAGLLSAKRFPCFPEYCLHDRDYEELLGIVQEGLEPAARPAHVVVVGAGIGGLTAAKLLRDAGHTVGNPKRLSRACFPPLRAGEGKGKAVGQPEWWKEICLQEFPLTLVPANQMSPLRSVFRAAGIPGVSKPSQGACESQRGFLRHRGTDGCCFQSPV